MWCTMRLVFSWDVSPTLTNHPHSKPIDDIYFHQYHLHCSACFQPVLGRKASLENNSKYQLFCIVHRDLSCTGDFWRNHQLAASRPLWRNQGCQEPNCLRVWRVSPTWLLLDSQECLSRLRHLIPSPLLRANRWAKARSRSLLLPLGLEN